MMKREIKFRGLNNSGEFEYGHLVKYRGHLEGFVTAIQVLRDDGTVNYLIPVNPESVGQFTGLTDKNGKEIYKSDIIKDLLTGAIMEVCFGFNRNGGYTGWYCKYLNIDRNGNCAINNDVNSDRNSMIEIIGNIHENPELLTQLEKK